MVPVTQQAHDFVRSILKPGENAIDATAGNGHDTLFLAQLVGPEGTVWAIDIQADAIRMTRERLLSHHCRHVEYLIGDHAHFETLIPAEVVGTVGAVMFNLGYLPGSDHQRITEPEKTVRALAAAIECLRPGGGLSVVTYRGHPGGAEEAQTVEEWLEHLSDDEFDKWQTPRQAPKRGPTLLAVTKQIRQPSGE